MTSLFDETGPNPHEHFVDLLRDGSRAAAIRKEIDQMWHWCRERNLLEDDFEEEFRRQTPQRWWELRTACLLDACGCMVERHRTARRQPDVDYACSVGDLSFYVEATVPTSGHEDHPDVLAPADWATVGTATRATELGREDKAVLRFTAALSSKASQYERCLAADVIDPEWPRVIALSPVHLEYLEGSALEGAVFDDIPGLGTLGMAVYGLGAGVSFSVDVSGDSPSISDTGLLRLQLDRTKASGQAIPTDGFVPSSSIADSYNVISAVFYSPLSYLKSSSAWKAGFAILHNSNATAVLRECVIDECYEWRIMPDGGRLSLVRVRRRIESNR